MIKNNNCQTSTRNWDLCFLRRKEK